MSTPEEPDEVKETPQKEAMESEGSVHNDFQDTDLDLKTVKKFLIGSFAVTLAVFVLMLMVHRFYKKSFTEERGVATEETRQIPSSEQVALLQTVPLEDLQDYKDGEAEKLNTKTDAGEHAVIPVEEAKQLMLKEKAFPTPEPRSESEGLSPMIASPSGGGESATPTKESASPASSTAPGGDEVAMIPKYSSPPDSAMVAAGKTIWETQCMAACHTGKKGAIGPNIHHAFGTMRKLESGESILMDKQYVINSMNNPKEHVAKGYMPVMQSFKEQLSSKQKEQVAEYLRSQGKEIMVPDPNAKPAKAEPAPSQPAPSEPTPEPQPAPAKESAPAKEPAPAKPDDSAPAAPEPKPTSEPGPIFV